MKKLITLVCCLAAIPVSAFAGPISPETPESHIAKKRLPARHDLWIRIGRCEQPGRGYKGIYWSHPGPTYQGGLGFYHGTWDAFKVKGMPDNAGDATWRQQMWVANRLYARYGTSPWGCG